MTFFGLTEEQTKKQQARMARVAERLKGLKPDSREYFLAVRDQGLGGSDMAPLMGLSDYKTAYQLYLEKTGRVQTQTETFAMRFGRWTEAFIAQEYTRLTWNDVKPYPTYCLEEIPYLVSNYDRVIVKNGEIIGGLEIKTCASNSQVIRGSELGPKWGKGNEYSPSGRLLSTDDTIDPLYMPQVQFYLYTSGLPFWDVAVLIGGGQGDLRIFRVFPDKDFQNRMIVAAATFWGKCVLDDMPPALTFDDTKNIPTNPTAEPVQADEELLKVAKEYKELQQKSKLLDARLIGLKNTIAAKLQTTEKAVFTDNFGKQRTLVSFKASSRKAFDTKAFETEHPDIYKHYIKDVKTARVLRVY